MLKQGYAGLWSATTRPLAGQATKDVGEGACAYWQLMVVGWSWSRLCVTMVVYRQHRLAIIGNVLSNDKFFILFLLEDLYKVDCDDILWRPILAVEVHITRERLLLRLFLICEGETR